VSKARAGIDLRARLTNRPLALAARAVDAAMLRPRPAALFGEIQTAAPDRQGWQFTDGGIALLPVMGPLLQRGDDFTAWFGITSYDDIADAAESAMSAPNVHGVLLEIDSPGGEVAGLFDLVDYLASLKSTYGKPLWAIAREQALSAAYAIAATCDRVYVTQTGEVGSVGVLAVHVDRSAHDEMDGRKYSLIHAGAKKSDGNPHIPLSPSAADDIQADIDDLYGRFVSRVANNRRISPQTVTATEAAIYRGQHALDAGLADVVGTLETAHADLLTSLNASLARTAAPKSTPTTSPSQERTTTMTTPKKTLRAAAPAVPVANNPVNDLPGDLENAAAPVALAAAPDAVAAQADAPTPEATTIVQPPAPAPIASALPIMGGPDLPRGVTVDSIRAEASEIAKIGAEAAKLGLTIDVPAALTAGTKPDALRRAVLEQLAATTDATIIASIAPRAVDAAPKESPLIAAAEAAAKTA